MINERGQALLEAVVAVGLVIILTTGLIAGTSFALRGGQESKTRSVAVKYTQEGLELTRALRDAGWNEFEQVYGGPAPSGKTWCLTGNGQWVSGSCEQANLIGGIYRRQIALVWDNSNERMDTTVVVSWSEGGATRQSQLKTFFTKWK